MIKTLENFASEELVNKIEEIVNSHEFPWFWRPSTVHGMNEKGADSKDFQFVHLVYYQGQPQSYLFEQTRELLLCIEKATGFVIKDINKIKANLLPKYELTPQALEEALHIDVEQGESNFMSFVYYVADSDGDTVIYESIDGALQPKYRKAPKKGTAVYFPSYMWHRATPPKDHKRRLVLNIIVEVE
jgi:hypothetical protein